MAQIDTGKLLIKDVFSDTKWYRVPEYQRPYVWSYDQITTFIDDIFYSSVNQSTSEYFLGNIVLHNCEVRIGDISFIQSDLLDGQQRLTTLFLLIAFARDRSQQKQLVDLLTKFIWQEANAFSNTPERVRIIYSIRSEVRDFIAEFIIKEKGTLDTDRLSYIIKDKNVDKSIVNMANAILVMDKHFTENKIQIEPFFHFLLTKVILIYVASNELDDALRMFTILNDRGIKLRNSDILKANNLRQLANESVRVEYALKWENWENDLGEDFDLFLSHIRTILLKDKAQLSLLNEFTKRIYGTKILKEGKDTFDLIDKYKKCYDNLEAFSRINDNYQYANLLKVFKYTSNSDIWISPLMFYMANNILGENFEFLKALFIKYLADWVEAKSPTKRLQSMLNIIQAIDNRIHKIDESPLINDDAFKIDKDQFLKLLDKSDLYRQGYAKMVLYLLDMIFNGVHTSLIEINQISIEHILPQNPDESSKWVLDFDQELRETLTHKLGNLLLIGKRKNTGLGRLDYVQKVEKYFSNNIQPFPNSLRVLQNKNWTSIELQANHELSLVKISEFIG